MDQENLFQIFEEKIRRGIDPKSGKLCFSIVDVIAVITHSSDPRNYWKVLKNRLNKAQNKLVTECNQLKMRSNDGKFYLTDTADEDTLLEIIKLVSEDYVIPFKLWSGKLEQKKSLTFDAKKANSFLDSDGYESYPHLAIPQEEELELLIDGYIKNNIITIEAFVAGIETENILVSVTCNSITISGERKTEKNSALTNYSNQELSWGKFSRTLSLPNEVEINLTEANIFHGLLTIKLPLINKERSRIIRIKNI